MLLHCGGANVAVHWAVPLVDRGEVGKLVQPSCAGDA